MFLNYSNSIQNTNSNLAIFSNQKILIIVKDHIPLPF